MPPRARTRSHRSAPAARPKPTTSQGKTPRTRTQLALATHAASHAESPSSAARCSSRIVECHFPLVAVQLVRGNRVAQLMLGKHKRDMAIVVIAAIGSNGGSHISTVSHCTDSRRVSRVSSTSSGSMASNSRRCRPRQADINGEWITNRPPTVHPSQYRRPPPESNASGCSLIGSSMRIDFLPASSSSIKWPTSRPANHGQDRRLFVVFAGESQPIRNQIAHVRRRAGQTHRHVRVATNARKRGRQKLPQQIQLRRHRLLRRPRNIVERRSPFPLHASGKFVSMSCFMPWCIPRGHGSFSIVSLFRLASSKQYVMFTVTPGCRLRIAKP